MRLVIYSPAPVTTDLHKANIDLTSCLGSDEASLSPEIVAMPLPDSIDAINALPGADKPFHLPIVTSVDLLPAIHRQGPDWHAYDRANTDLKLATALYDVGFGLLATSEGISSPDDLRGRSIGVPARPSSVRVFTETLLRDGWGILDAVELVDLPPPAIPGAISAGRIEATTWNLMTVGARHTSALLPGLLQSPDARWIEVDDQAVARINAANSFKISALRVRTDRIAGLQSGPAPAVNLLSFRQGLAVWNTTPDDVVSAVLETLKSRGPEFPSLPRSPAEMANWPFLTKALLHPAARDFFRRNGIDVD